MQRRRLSRWVLSITLAATSLTMLTGGGIREDELRCEEAKKHLMDCCGSVDYLDCLYVPGSCGSSDTYPDLDPKTAVCLRDASCDTLRASRACSNATGVSCE